MELTANDGGGRDKVDVPDLVHPYASLARGANMSLCVVLFAYGFDRQAVRCCRGSD